MTEPLLRLVADGVLVPPYPADTSMAGVKLMLDVSRIEQSRTWIATPPEVRPWLLLLWSRSWLNRPAGAYPADDDEAIAGRLDMPLAMFQTYRDKLLRKWYRCTDGNLYHPVLVELVLERLAERDRWRRNKAGHRGDHPTTPLVLEDSSESHGSSTAGVGVGVGVDLLGSALEKPLRSVRSASKAARTDLRGKRLPPDMPLPDEWKAWAIACYPKLTGPQVVRQWVEFRNYWSDVPGEKGVKLRWFQTWQNRVHSNMERGR